MSLIKCSNCGKEISDQSNFCTSCGNSTKSINNITNEIKNINETKTSNNKGIKQDSLDIMFIITGVLLFASLFITCIHAKAVLYYQTIKTYDLSLITSNGGKIILALLIIDVILTILIKTNKVSKNINKIKFIFPIIMMACLIYVASKSESVYISSKTYLVTEFRMGYYLAWLSSITLLIESILRIFAKERKSVRYTNNSSYETDIIDIDDIPEI